jgi:hypothetical protein
MHFAGNCCVGLYMLIVQYIQYFSYLLELDASRATAVAKQLRPIIEPIGSLGEFLRRFEAARALSTARR